MKKEILYVCEICGKKFKSASKAKECEKQGIPDKDKFPVGLIFNDPTAPSDSFYKDITFAVAKVNVQGHYMGVSAWACRDNGAGDNLDEYCSYYPLDGKDEPNRNHPTFKRMVKALKKKRIPITVWNGKKAVKL
ncbi:MAG: hypothetical protein KAW92_10465 [Candidatus Cloacimonetes bacterium]|nr:hypothetical protein [Candidatus Cloacimonadota bacterium]